MEKKDYLKIMQISKKLEEIAKQKEKPLTEIIDMFILDLQNFGQEGYAKKIDVDLKNLPLDVKGEFINHLNRVKKRNKQKEVTDKRTAKKQELQKTWKEFEQSIEGNIMDPEVMKKAIDDIENSDLSRKEKNFMKVQLDEKSKKFNKTWESIKNMVEKQSGENTNKTKSEYWQAIRKLITDRDKRLNIKMNEEMEKQMISMIGDEIYYEQVKAFTSDFSFLRDDPLIARATIGTRRVKFTDRESYDRYCNLRDLLQEGHRGEYQKIEGVLKEGKVDKSDRRILEERMQVMEKEASKMPDAR